MRSAPRIRDRYALYEASVQGAEYDLDFIERVYRRAHGRRPRLLREDFCGTALLACEWIARRPENLAMALDLDPEPLAWAREHRISRMGAAARRLKLWRRDARSRTRPLADVAVAFNYSYWVFKSRAELVRYFRNARASLRRGGMLFANAFGGTEAMSALRETRRVAASQAADGTRLPAFTYIWEQASFNPVDHQLVSHIHFRLPRGVTMRRAFTYDWRLWTLPEIQECMLEAGFRRSDVYVEGWNDERHEPDHVYRHRLRFENQEGWLSYVVGLA